MDGSADKDEDLIGVPHLMVDVADRTKPSSIKIFDMGRLPTVEEVYYMYYLGLDLTKPIFGISGKARLTQISTASEIM